MKAMILAAGRGQRMRPLTDSVPKPLLEVAGRTLIEHLIDRLVRAGFHELIINNAWLGKQIMDRVGDGARYGAQITHSCEPEKALDTAGGIRHALALLSDPFLAINADVWSDYPLEKLRDSAKRLKSASWNAHLIMVSNPCHHPIGDFRLRDGILVPDKEDRLTFSGIGLYRKSSFAGLTPGVRALGPLLREWIAAGQVSAEHYDGTWIDVGTPARLLQLKRHLREHHA